jgi:dihydroorotate dehydrogenase
MSNLSVDVGGLRLKNPVVASSCEYTMTEAGIRACIDAGAGAVVAKSINESAAARRQLDIADYVLFDPALERVEWGAATGNETLFNRSGLAQTSLNDWVELLARMQSYAVAAGSAVIGSITLGSVDGAVAIAKRMSGVVPALEVNVGAPHAREAAAVRQIATADDVRQTVPALRTAFEGTLILKLPAQATDIVGMAAAASTSGADVVSMIGRLNGFVPNLETGAAELGSWGAIGGPWMLPVSLYWVSKSYSAFEPQIIGSNGARNGHDVARFVLAGARAVEVASVLMISGANALTGIIDELDAYLDGRGIDSVASIIGAATRASREYADIPPLPVQAWPWTNPTKAQT